MTTNTRTDFRSLSQFHVWVRGYFSNVWTYRGWVWAGNPAEAAHLARERYGVGNVFRIQLTRNGGIVLKTA